MSRGQHITVLGTGTLVVEHCYKCKTAFAMEKSIYETAIRAKEKFGFYCPLGHSQTYVTGETELEKVRRERDRLLQKVAEKDDDIRIARDQRDAADRRASAQKGQVTRLKNRASKGVCPCCNRHFKNLQAHMDTKHPEFAKETA